MFAPSTAALRIVMFGELIRKLVQPLTSIRRGR